MATLQERQQQQFEDAARYEQYFAWHTKRFMDEYAQDMGGAALTVITGGAIARRFETVVPVDRYVQNEPLPEKLTRPMAAVSLRGIYTPEKPRLNSHAYTGYGSGTARSTEALVA